MTVDYGLNARIGCYPVLCPVVKQGPLFSAAGIIRIAFAG